MFPFSFHEVFGVFLAFLLFLLVAGTVLVMAVDYVRSGKPLLDDTIAHWHNTLQGVSISPSEFYDRVVHKIADWDLPGVTYTGVGLHEGGRMSWKRSYLRVKRLEYVYDIGLYPFGGGVFVSSWLREPTPAYLKVLLSIPVVRTVVAALTPKTYFKVDAAICFQEVTHAAVLSVLDEITNAEQVTPIPEQERKPVMRELYMGNVGFVGPRAPALR